MKLSHRTRHDEWISPKPSELHRIMISTLFTASSAIYLTEPNVITEEWKISAPVTTQSISAVRLEQFTSHQISAPQQDFLAAPENCQRDDWPHVNSWPRGRNACMACLIEQGEVLMCFPASRRTRWTGCTDADSGVSAHVLKALQAFKKRKPISDTDATSQAGTITTQTLKKRSEGENRWSSEGNALLRRPS